MLDRNVKLMSITLVRIVELMRLGLSRVIYAKHFSLNRTVDAKRFTLDFIVISQGFMMLSADKITSFMKHKRERDRNTLVSNIRSARKTKSSRPQKLGTTTSKRAAQSMQEK